MEKLNLLKTFLKMAGGRMHTPHPNSLYPPPAISYRNHQKSRTHFSHLAVGTINLVLFTTRLSQKRGAWLNALLPPLNTLLLGLTSFFLLTGTLSWEKNNASRPDGEDFSFSMYQCDKLSISR